MAKGSIGNISMGLSANITGFKSSMMQAAATTKKTTATISGSFSSMTKGISGAMNALTSFGGLMGGVTVASMVALAKQSSDFIDTTGKLSDQLGIQTEALAALTHEADLAGVTQEALVKALKTMQVAISNAAEKGGVAGESFARLGLDIASISKLSSEEQFYAVAEAMSKMEAGADKTRLATELFGKAGLDMISMLNLGSEGLRKSAENADALGLSFSRIDAAQVEAANDAVTRLTSAVGGLFNELVIDSAPALEGFANFLTGVIRASKQTEAEMQKTQKSMASIGFGVGIDALGAMTVEADKKAKAIETTPVGIGVLKQPESKTPDPLGITKPEEKGGILSDLMPKPFSMLDGIDKANQGKSYIDSLYDSIVTPHIEAGKRQYEMNAALEEEKKKREEVSDEIETQLDMTKEKQDLEGGFTLTKAGRLASFQPGAQSSSDKNGDGWTPGKVDEELGLLKQIANNKAVLA